MTSNQRRITSLIKSISGQSNVLTIPRVFIDLLEKDFNAALLLSQCIYWSDKTNDSDGWFYKSYKEWENEIGMTQFQVKRAATTLAAIGLVEVVKKKAMGAPTLHYRVNLENLSNLIIEKLDYQETSLSTNSTIDNEETAQSDYQETSQSLTDITQEINSETTKAIAGEEGRAPPLVTVFAAYEEEIGPLTPMISESLQDLEKEHTPTWVIAAIKVASANNKRSLAYFTAILDRWKVEGYGSEFKKKVRSNGKRPNKLGTDADEPAGFAGIRAWLKEQEAIDAET